VTKSAKAAWSSLLVELAPILAAFLLPLILRRFTGAPAAAACGCGEGRRKLVLGILVLAGYALFIGLTVFLVKVSWRYL
jgi:hypothetical protein